MDKSNKKNKTKKRHDTPPFIDNDETLSQTTPLISSVQDLDTNTELQQPTHSTGYSQLSDFAAESSDSPISIGIGVTINQRFTLEKLLGRGGMGDVYLASDKRKIEAQDKTPYVAIKLLGDNFKRHPQAFIALQREARKTQQLAHPNIVTVYDFDRQADTVYLTMEALDGHPMDKEISVKTKNRSCSEAIKLINQCASGLAYAHQKKLIHSDLKPGNVFITTDGTVKLLDFGIARAFHSGKSLSQSEANNSHDTVFDAGELGALTPAYASLEMIQGQEPHPSDDVYALGIIAYELLTGRHPFNRTMANKAQETSLRPQKIPELNKNQWQAIEQALRFDREHRLDNAQAFLDRFNAKSKLPLIITATVTTIAFITVASLNLWFAPVEGPGIAFEDLPKEQQINIKQQIRDAQTAMTFKDYNSAILHLDNAYQLHPRNTEVMLAINEVLEELMLVLNDKERFDNKSRQKQIDSLLAYESLKDHELLK